MISNASGWTSRRFLFARPIAVIVSHVGIACRPCRPVLSAVIALRYWCCHADITVLWRYVVVNVVLRVNAWCIKFNLDDIDSSLPITKGAFPDPALRTMFTHKEDCRRDRLEASQQIL